MITTIIRTVDSYSVQTQFEEGKDSDVLVISFMHQLAGYFRCNGKSSSVRGLKFSFYFPFDTHFASTVFLFLLSSLFSFRDRDQTVSEYVPPCKHSLPSPLFSR